MKILVTGASGFIGSHIVDQALSMGYETWAAVRPTSNLSYLKGSDVQCVTLEFDDAALLEQRLRVHRDSHGAWNVVIHCAGATKCRHKDEFDRINYEGTRMLVDTLMQLDMIPNQFIFISTLGIYGSLHEQEPHRSFVETDVPRPNTLYGKSKLKAEWYVRGVDALPYVIFRPTGVYGPRDKDYQILIRSIRSHIDLSLGLRPQQITFVYIKDLVQAVFLAIEKGVKRRSYLITDGNTYNSSDFTDAVRAAMDNPFTLHIPVPLWMGRIAASIVDVCGRVLGHSFTFNSDKFRILAQRNWKCDISPLLDELGYRPRYNLIDGVAETLAEQGA